MVDAQEQPWSDNPNAPKISHTVYFEEKASYAGILIASMLYGTYRVFQPTRMSIDVHLFCLFDFRDPRRGIFSVYGCTA